MAPDHLLFCWQDYSHSYKNQITYKDQRQMYFTLHQIRLLRVTGVLSLSENLARHRPTWFGGSGNFPAICAVDNDNDTCKTVRPNEFMVVDLGFNSNTTLHVIIITDGGYYIHTCARARACVCLSVTNATSEKVSGSIYFRLSDRTGDNTFPILLCLFVCLFVKMFVRTI